MWLQKALTGVGAAANPQKFGELFFVVLKADGRRHARGCPLIALENRREIGRGVEVSCKSGILRVSKR
jgi:hypothetical protein